MGRQAVKVVKVDRVEWVYYSRQRHGGERTRSRRGRLVAAAAADLVPLLQRNKDVTVANVDPLGSIGVLRFNQLQPPTSTTRSSARRCSTSSTSRT